MLRNYCLRWYYSLHLFLHRSASLSGRLNLFVPMATMTTLLILALRTDTTAQSFSSAVDIIRAKRGGRTTTTAVTIETPATVRNLTRVDSQTGAIKAPDVPADTRGDDKCCSSFSLLSSSLVWAAAIMLALALGITVVVVSGL